MRDLIIKEGIEIIDENTIGKVAEGESCKLVLPKSVKLIDYSSFSELVFIGRIEYNGTLKEWDTNVKIIGELNEIPIKCSDKTIVYR